MPITIRPMRVDEGHRFLGIHHGAVRGLVGATIRPTSFRRGQQPRHRTISRRRRAKLLSKLSTLSGNAAAISEQPRPKDGSGPRLRYVWAGHLLVIPLTHAEYLADLDPTVGEHLFRVVQGLAAGIRQSGLKAEGINFFLANGEAAGQEVFHVHLHVFRRFEGDGFGLRFSPEYGQTVVRERLDREATAISKAAATA